MNGIRPRWNKVLADLLSNKVRSLLVIASITVGVFAAGLILSIYGILSPDMRSSYQKTNPANVTITAPNFDPKFTDTINNMPEIKRAEAARTFTLQLHVPSGPNSGPDDNWITISVKAVPDYQKMTLNQVALIGGQWPPKDKQIVFDQHKFSDAQTALGGTVEVKLPDDKLRTIPVVGLVQDQSIGANGGSFFSANLQGYVTFNTLEWLEQDDSANQLLASVAANGNDNTHIFDVARLVSKKFEDNNQPIISLSVRASNQHPNVGYIDAISGILVILGLLVVFLSGFLITNTFSALLNQQTEQIGIIKTLGGRTGQIIVIFMALILVYSLISLMVALPLASLAAYRLLGFLAQAINFNLQGFRVVPMAVYAEIFIALIIPQVAGFVPILNGARVSVQDAINGPTINPQEGGQSWLVRLIDRIRGIPRPLILSLRNTFRGKTRLLLTLMTLTLGGAMFIATFNVQSSMNTFVVKLSHYFAADVTLDFDQPYDISRIDTLLKTQPGVSRVEGWGSARGVLMLAGDKPGESVSLLAPPANSPLIQPVLLQGRWIIPGDQNAIVISDNFKSHYPDLKLGDTIRMQIYGKKVDWVLVGVFQFAGSSGGMLSYVNYDYLSQVTHTELKASSYRIQSNQPKITLAQQQQLGDALGGFFDGLGYRVVNISAGQSLLASAANGFNILTIFLLIMSMLAAIVGSIGLTGTLSMNVMDRTREIAVMRAIGATDRDISQLVVVEGLMIGLISWILGSLLAFPISQALWGIVSNSLFNSVSSFTFNANGFIFWMIVELILAVMASVIPARSAARLTIREALAYE